jgi:hypothetical protein
VRHDEAVHHHHRRQKHAVILSDAKGEETRVDDVLMGFAVELQPSGVAHGQAVALIDPDVPRRAKRAIADHHDDGQPTMTGRKDVLSHVEQTVGRAGGERSRTGHRRTDAHGHGAVLRFHGHVAALGKRVAREMLGDLGLRRDGVGGAVAATCGAIGVAGGGKRAARGLVPREHAQAHGRAATGSRSRRRTVIVIIASSR